MEDFLIFFIHTILFIGVAVTTLYINEYSTLIAVGFDVLYLITVKIVSDELN